MSPGDSGGIVELHHLLGARALVEELMDSRASISETGYTSFGAREGTHDDPVLTVANRGVIGLQDAAGDATRAVQRLMDAEARARALKAQAILCFYNSRRLVTIRSARP